MISFRPPEKTDEQLKSLAASGCKGCVAARKELQQRQHERLRRAVK